VTAWALAALATTQCKPRSTSGASSDARARDARSPRAPSSAPRPYARLRIVERDIRFDTEAAMRAGVEMQTSGEPFAELMGRSLAGYDRNARAPDRYQHRGRTIVDLTGYAAAVESYEYSRQPMNNVAFESGAGIALPFSPTLARGRSASGRALGGAALVGMDAIEAMRALVTRAAIGSRAGVRVAEGERPRGFVTIPVPEDNPLNRVGFGGLWATSVAYAGFDPTIRPSNNIGRGCTIEGGYGASAGQSVLVGDYECGYSSLHLPSRFGQLETVVTPGAAGAALWKYALWIINYLQLFHDGEGRPVTRVREDELARVGVESNAVRGLREDDTPSVGGVYLGSSEIEGFHGALLIASTVAATDWILSRALVTEGGRPAGFASLGEVEAHSDRSSPRWMPGRIVVDEEDDAVAGFARAARTTAVDAAPTLRGQLELVAGFATLFALVDDDNPEVGASQSARAYFDGDPFDRASVRDRWLAGLRWSLVTLEQLFSEVPSTTYRSSARAPSGAAASAASDAGSGGARDDARAQRHFISVEDAALAVQVLRLARRALSGRLVLYGDATPDGRATRCALDRAARPMFEEETVVSKLDTRIRAHAELLFERLTNEEGIVRRGWPEGEPEPTRIESELAAVRGLLEAFLATGEVRFRARALRVWQRIEAGRWDDELGLYRAGASRDDREDLRWSAWRWAHYTSAAREVYKLIGARPGEEALGRTVLERWTRSSKLILNGWNDLDRDDHVDWPDECVFVRDGLVRGGLQMAERALTGELGAEGGQRTADRDRDCVPEIDDAMLPAALASSVLFEVQR
jgi:hypothetical protein